MRVSGKLAGIVAVAFLCLSATTAYAHHSFAAEYDGNKPVTLHGKVSGMSWSNPHSWLEIEVKSSEGAIQNWRCEFGSPNQLYRKGVKKSDLPVGAEVTVNGFLAKDGTTTMNAATVTLSDGRQLFAGPSNNAPTPEN